MEDFNISAEKETAEKRLMEIIEEAEEVGKIYPSFNLDDEMENPVFRRLLAAGVPVISAYELVHRNEVNTILVEKAVRKAEKKITAAIQSGAKRPNENGSYAAVKAEFDPRQLSKSDRKDLRERVNRGEKVYL